VRGITTASAPTLPTNLLFDGRAFERADAADAGLTQHDVTELVKAGVLRQTIRGVYVDARLPDDLASRAACLRLRLPPDAVVARVTAAWLWGVDGRAPEQLGPVECVECAVPPGRQPVRRPGVRCYVAPLFGDTCVAAGVPATTPARTAIDVMRWLPPHMGLAIADALAARGLVTPTELVAHVEDFPATRGVRQARYLAGLVEPRTESFGESWLRLRIVDAGFPRPTVQIEVLDSFGRCVYRLDLGWEGRRVAVEYDGERYHSTPEQVSRDLRRRDDLERTFGWRVLGVGRGEVLGSSLALERAVSELLSLEPQIRRRRW
jgi:AbiEi antitoxin C-terminal domain